MSSRPALTCPVCGAPREPSVVRCGYCGSWLAVFAGEASDVPIDEGLLRERIDRFRRQLATDPDNIDALYGIGVAWRSLGLFDDATRVLTRAANRRPEALAIQRALAGTLLDAVRRQPDDGRMWRDVRRQAERILALDPEALEGWRLLGEVALRTRDDEELIALAPELARRDPTGDHRRVAARLLDTGERWFRDWAWEGAVEAWAALAEIDPRAGRTALVAFLLENARLVPRSAGRVWRGVRQTMALRGNFRMSLLASIALGLAVAVGLAVLIYLTNEELFPPVVSIGVVMLPILSAVLVRAWLVGWPPFPVPRQPWRGVPTGEIVAVARRIAPRIERIRPERGR
jgi:tetratricopeptide (TPR) repeat protein